MHDLTWTVSCGKLSQCAKHVNCMIQAIRQLVERLNSEGLHEQLAACHTLAALVEIEVSRSTLSACTCCLTDEPEFAMLM